ncbi:hypothetical protein E8E14_013276 [Neopestalotiopsis sp. 37M]|nr:hypothetical protein E8E14_013276 [Neopestalotiopsis sp. 37M]
MAKERSVQRVNPDSDDDRDHADDLIPPILPQNPRHEDELADSESLYDDDESMYDDDDEDDNDDDDDEDRPARSTRSTRKRNGSNLFRDTHKKRSRAHRPHLNAQRILTDIDRHTTNQNDQEYEEQGGMKKSLKNLRAHVRELLREEEEDEEVAAPGAAAAGSLREQLEGLVGQIVDVVVAAVESA